jgi:hypothetical protein
VMTKTDNLSARLKSCPDTNRALTEFSAAREDGFAARIEARQRGAQESM